MQEEIARSIASIRKESNSPQRLFTLIGHAQLIQNMRLYPLSVCKKTTIHFQAEQDSSNIIA